MSSLAQANSAFEDVEIDLTERNSTNHDSRCRREDREGTLKFGDDSSISRSMANKQLTDESSSTSEEFSFRKLSGRAHEKIRNACTIKLLKCRLPFLQWAPTYSFSFLIYDFLAGFTAALTGIPQGIAYGSVAGVPVEYGLYTALAGPMVYAFLGSVAQVTVGPTAVMALMASEYVQKGGIEYAVVLSFLAGCFELLAGLLNLGFLVDFISGPVISGFCSAAATTVIFSQIKTILGLRFPGSSFTKVIPGIFSNLESVILWDTVLGCLCIVFILALKNLTSVKHLFKTAAFLKNRYVEKTIWYTATCRNAIALLVSCLIAYALSNYTSNPFTLTGDIRSGIPSITLPPFTFERRLSTNNSNSLEPHEASETVTLITIIGDIGSGLVLVPVIAILEQVAIAKAFCKDKKLDSTQEMLALGAGSVVCSFFGCFPPTASFARSSVLAVSGGKTQLASFFNGCVVLAALAFLMPAFYYIPKAVLGAVIITAVYPMVEYHELFALLKSRRIELLPFLITYICCLLIGLEYGILIGIQVHLLLVVYEATKAKISISLVEEGTEQIVLAIDRSLYFPSVERLRNALDKVSRSCPSKKTVVLIDLAKVVDVDHTNLKVLIAKLKTFDKTGIQCEIINASKEIRKALESTFS